MVWPVYLVAILVARSFFFVLLSRVTHPVTHPFCCFEMSVEGRVERPNTLIATIPEEFSSLSQAEIVDKLVSVLGVDQIACIQFVPRCYVRITFSTFDARNKVFMSGILVDEIPLYMVEADPVFKDVYLELLPAEVDDDVVRDALSRLVLFMRSFH